MTWISGRTPRSSSPPMRRRALVVIGLIAWVLADHAAQRRLLADLEARGMTRRSDNRRPHEHGRVRRESPARRRLFVLLPLLLFLALAALFFFRLGSGDPSRLPSALIGRPAPETNLAPVPGLLTRDGKPLPGIDGGGFQGRRDAGQCVGLVVRAVSRRGAAARMR